MLEGATANASRDNRTAIPVTCALRQGPRGFANLVVERQGDEIIFDPHVTDACVIIFDDAAADTLFTLLGTWLGYEPAPENRPRCATGRHRCALDVLREVLTW
ncbi:MAG: hypothetical protein JO272_15150 [Pseudonocardiales bacterium]|nr:hypothetical protein [Pseudonocardiales bacterium]